MSASTAGAATIPALADPSRETGIPRIGVVSTEVTPGAAGTIANNLAALGAGHVAVLGMVGDDGFGYELRAALAARGISHELLVDAPGVPTFTYTKLINAQTGEEDLPRVDFVYTQAAAGTPWSGNWSRAWNAPRPHYDVILVSDQAETSQGGVVTPAMREAIARLALAHPRKVDLGGFPPARRTLPPRRGEAQSAGGRSRLPARSGTHRLPGTAPPHAGAAA